MKKPYMDGKLTPRSLVCKSRDLMTQSHTWASGCSSHSLWGALENVFHQDCRFCKSMLCREWSAFENNPGVTGNQTTRLVPKPCERRCRVGSVDPRPHPESGVHESAVLQCYSAAVPAGWCRIRARGRAGWARTPGS
jgi:hypothetical protein